MVNLRLISRLRRVDWDFSGSYSESPFSALHWHPGRFASQIPATLVGLLSKRGDIVLDPFVGSGTLLVEAQRLGCPSIGIDVNPVSCLIAKAKTFSVQAGTIAKDIGAVLEEVNVCLSRQLPLIEEEPRQITIPDTVQATKWYTRTVCEDLGKFWTLIQTLKGRRRTLAEAAFSASLLSVCRETRHWGYVCDNSTPRSNHGGDVLVEVAGFLNSLETSYQDRDADRAHRFGDVGRIEAAQVICGDARDALAQVDTGSVDLVVTSPPYFGVCDYVKAQRLSMEWFASDIEPLRQREVGARSKRHRRTAFEDYLNEMLQAYELLYRCIRRGGVCAVVLGQSSARDAVLDRTRRVLREIGFKLDVDMNRSVSSQRRQAPSIHDEHIFVCSRP